MTLIWMPALPAILLCPSRLYSTLTDLDAFAARYPVMPFTTEVNTDGEGVGDVVVDAFRPSGQVRVDSSTCGRDADGFCR